MGYGTRPNSFGGNIRTFTPDDTLTTLYIEADYYGPSIDKLLGSIQNHFGPGHALSEFEIHSEHIHTDCLGYDSYDPNDYTNYLVVTKVSE